MPVSLLPTKLHRPRLGPQMVPRHDLLERLDAAREVRLTLLSAPAGFGKTTLAAAWLALRSPPSLSAAALSSPAAALSPSAAALSSPAAAPSPPTAPPPLHAAWLTLDAGDNDPLRFWTYTTASLHDSLALPGLAALLERLQSPHPPPLEQGVETLLAILAAEPQPGDPHSGEPQPGDAALVLDDYQAIQAQEVHDALYFFLRHLPPHVHVVLLTRADPPLPLQRWRVHGQLLELRAHDLCFSAKEAGAMLSRRTRHVLPPETIELLVEHTDGWPAGLQLLAASLQGRGAREVSRFAAAFNGSNPFVLRYLFEEVLQSQPLPVRNFLLRTSILSRFCAPLCDLLLDTCEPDEGPDADQAAGGEAPLTSHAILAYLEQQNLFLVPLDDEGRWHRYYHLFAEALRGELERTAPALAPALHRCAGRWYAEHGFLPEAIDHALVAQDWEQAGEHLAGIAYATLLTGNFAALNRWMELLPEAVIEAQPRLALTRAWLLIFRGPLHRVEQLIQGLIERVGLVGLNTAPATLRRRPAPGEPGALLAMLAAFRWEVRETYALCAQTTALLAPDDHFSAAAVHQAWGLAHLLAGRLRAAEEEFVLSAAAAQQLGSGYLYLVPYFRQGHCYAVQGRLDAALHLYRRGLQMAHDHGGDHWPVLADCYTGLADVLRERNDLLAAEHYAGRGLALAPQRSVESWAWARVVQARIALALGRPDGSLLVLQDAIDAAIQYNNNHLAGYLMAHQARLDLAAGNLDAVRVWDGTHRRGWSEGGYLPEFEELTRARFYLADHRPRAALALLTQWQAHAEAAARVRSLVEIDTLLAATRLALGQRQAALETLRRALALAEAEGMQRTFLDEGPRLVPLLDALAPASAFAARLRAALDAVSPPGQAAPSLTEPLDRLTPREAEVLRALARGASNQEIADAYVLTVGTVKGHVNHILSKLSARNRTEAVAHARELGLL